MTMLDQFESVFRAASKTVYRYRALDFPKLLVVTDADEAAAAKFADAAVAQVSAIGKPEVEVLCGGMADTVGELLEAVQRGAPDLVCTYRNLHSGAWRWPYTLGDHVEVLTQVTAVPVLLMPRPDIEAALDRRGNTDRVMAITDHLEGAEGLVNAAVAFTNTGGTLYLTHVEDDAVFERYIEAAGRTPKIDTDQAREALRDTLLKGPRDYVATCAGALRAEAGVDVVIEPVIEMGHHLAMYKALVRSHDIDLLLMNSKDDDQLAMHGLAYPLAVELRDTPLLML
jgi:hypothetical protein